MKTRPLTRRFLPRSLALLVLFAGAGPVAAQYAGWGMDENNPIWSAFIPRLKYIATEVEVDQSRYTFNHSSSGNLSNQRIYFSTGIGIGWDYYIYHPDLFSFSILGEPGYQWDRTDGSSYSVRQENLLLNGLFTGTLLREKPYATTISYFRSHDTYQYDFFDTAIADTEDLNVSTGYTTGLIPFTVTLQKSTTDITDFNRETINDQLTMTLHARNERDQHNFTDFNYQFSQSDYSSIYQSATSSSENTYQRVSLIDHESFTRSTLSTSLQFDDASSTHSTSENLNFSTNFRYEHTQALSSFYNYSLSTFSGDGGDSVQHFVSVGLTHQLYESLASSVNLRGSTLNSSSFDSTMDSKTYGAGGSEEYNKKLGNWGRLSIGTAVSYDITDQHVSGTMQFIPDESHVVPTNGPMIIRLDQPREISITSVKKNNIELDGSEWTAIQTSDPWQVQFFSAGPNNVQPGDTITISYNINSNPSGSYAVFTDGSHISLQFWHDRAEIYAGYNFTRNYASSKDFVLENTRQLEAGAQYGWNGFRFQARYTDQNSTLYSFQSFNLSEGYTTPVTHDSTLGIDFSQQWNVYPPGSGTSTNRTQIGSFYTYTLRYEWHPTGNFDCRAEIGLQDQGGLGYDQDRLAARVYANWRVGKLEFHFGVEHEQETYTAERREQDLVFLRMRRNF